MIGVGGAVNDALTDDVGEVKMVGTRPFGEAAGVSTNSDLRLNRNLVLLEEQSKR